MPARPLGFAAELAPLADHLAATTDLGRRRSPFLGSIVDDRTAITARFLSPMALHYLLSLESLEEPEDRLISVIGDELDDLCDQPGYPFIRQLVVTGVLPSKQIEYNGVCLRPLTRRERGLVYRSQGFTFTSPDREFDDLILATGPDASVPASLLSIRTIKNSLDERVDDALPSRLALAFLLKDYEIGSTGHLSYDHLPRWASFGFAGREHFPRGVEHTSLRNVPIAEGEFREVVDLAISIPRFGGHEGSAEEIVLFRALRGLGRAQTESAFLDLAIALEAALLRGSRTELAYKFRLYGALFLESEMPSEWTFRALKRIYDVRSKLVHGGSVSEEDRIAATRDANQILKMTIVKALSDGWPNPKSLDECALSAPPECPPVSD